MIARPPPGARGGRVIVALDTSDLHHARALAQALRGSVGLVKCGLELFAGVGPGAVTELGRDASVFLDLKLHDIPNTVAGAVRALRPLGAAMLTLHAAGGAAMIAAGREAAGEGGPMLLAVTILTSLDAAALAETGVPDAPRAQVLRLARLALSAGADGLICSPEEVAPLRDALGAAPILVVPGIRPAGAAVCDQRRTATPAEAVAAGADWIVVGRPITGAADPAAAARALFD